MNDAAPPTSAHPHPWASLLLGVVWLTAAAWLWASTADVMLAGHPAYPVLTTAAALIGLLLLHRAWRRWSRTGRPSRSWVRALGRGTGTLITLLVIGTLVWLRPFSASDAAIEEMDGTAQVRVTSTSTLITLSPLEMTPRVGLVFQPGARVDPRAYVPLLARVSEAGVLVVVIKQPLDIAFTAIGAPADIIADHPEIDAWTIGGHSLGGVAASAYAADHPDQVDGLLLWASYPLDSLADRSDLAVTSVSGTLDGLATPKDIEKSRVDLPASTSFVPVEGAVHAFFGDYGAQPGDGEPTISRAEAQDQIVAASIDLVKSVPRSTGSR